MVVTKTIKIIETALLLQICLLLSQCTSKVKPGTLKNPISSPVNNNSTTESVQIILLANAFSRP